MIEPRYVLSRRDGVRIAALDWGGDAPPLVVLHPNGFCGGVFEPLARALGGTYRVIAVDLRGHGASDAPREKEAYHFVELARDVVALLDMLELEEVLVLGQSLGGGVAALVDHERPGLVARALLCEAVAFPILPTGGGPNPMSEAARRRRACWPDRPSIVAAYRTKPPLSELAPAALNAYVRWGTVDDDGTVRLACPPEVEAIIFELSATPYGAPAAFTVLAGLDTRATILAGDRSYLPLGFFHAQSEQVGSDLVVVPGGHFMVQEDADRAAQWVMTYLPPRAARSSASRP
jgi:pimeloyl-ACP methyl ester carboxylesterase